MLYNKSKQNLFFFLSFTLLITLIHSVPASSDIKTEIDILEKTRSERLNNYLKTTKLQPSKERLPMVINSDFGITGTLSTNQVSAETGEASGNIKILNTSKMNNLSSNKLTSSTLLVEKIIPENGVLTLNGNVILTNDITSEQGSSNGKGGMFNGNGVEQWKIVKHDDFETVDSLEGWSDKRVNKCKGSNNIHLGGHCNFAGNEVKKVFNISNKHKQVRVNARYHMLDLWKGETGYMKVNGEIVWSRKGNMRNKGIDFCGGAFNDPEFNGGIDVTVDNSENEIEVLFGSSLKGDACMHSFAVDDVMIYTK